MAGLRNLLCVRLGPLRDAALTTPSPPIFDAVLADAQKLDGEQEGLTSRLAEKTAELTAKLEEVAKASARGQEAG